MEDGKIFGKIYKNTKQDLYLIPFVFNNNLLIISVNIFSLRTKQAQQSYPQLLILCFTQQYIKRTFLLGGLGSVSQIVISAPFTGAYIL